MHIDKIDKYFADRNTKVIYNCLGHTEELVRSYVANFQDLVDNTVKKQSQHVKHSCYSALYSFELRQKFTGFEKYKKIDNSFRTNISSAIYEAQFSPTLIVDSTENQVTSDYKSVLKSFVSTIENPLLYLSGGIDSELVAVTMLDSDKKFTPVIFQYTNNLGQIVNLFDTNYAIEFCNKHNLFPIIKTINIEELWSSNDFAKLAIDLQIQSPHLVTHAYMVEMMKYQFPDHTHVFGGEVRFYTNHQLDDGRMANLVLLAKTTPSYNGSGYSATSFTGGTPASVTMNYYSDGSWDIYGYGNQSGSSASGTWTTTPGSAYEARISALTIATNQGLTQIAPGSAPTVWFDIASNTQMVEVIADPFSPASVVDATFTIQVRTKTGSQTGIIQSSTVNLYAEYNA